jgi:hypothetical protein
MPTILSLLRVDDAASRSKCGPPSLPTADGTGGDGREHGKKEPGQAARQEAITATIGNGMDWGLAAIYSCENSCDASHEEKIVVQAST